MERTLTSNNCFWLLCRQSFLLLWGLQWVGLSGIWGEWDSFPLDTVSVLPSIRPHFVLCPSLEAMAPGLVTVGWFCVGGRGAAAGDRPCWRAQEGSAGAAGLEGSEVTFPRAPVTFNAVEGTPLPPPQVLLGAPGPGQSLPFPGANWVVTTSAGGSWPSWTCRRWLGSELSGAACPHSLLRAVAQCPQGVRSGHAATAIPPRGEPARL